MLVRAVAEFFKYKIVSSVIILTCGNEFEQVRLVRELSIHGLRTTATCDPSLLDQELSSLQGVLYFMKPNDTLLDETKLEHFSAWYKWLIIGDEIPDRLHRVRYDADIVLLDPGQGTAQNYNALDSNNTIPYHESLYFSDVYVHGRAGASRHPWAACAPAGFEARHERARIRRRLHLQRYPMRIATPVGHYDESWYDGTFAEYVTDNTQPERDSAIRCGYGGSSLILERLHATEVLTQVEQWGTEVGNRSMFTRLADGTSELSGSILRVQAKRLSKVDYLIPLWPFKVGFTYVSERESNSNMFVMPFTGATWVAFAVITLILAFAQRITAKEPFEKEGAFVAVMATILQQDASAVPEGASGRFTFMVLSVCSTLVYAYYTSAIVSALMSAGGGGPTTLRALADSRYSLASEDYDWIRYHIFDVFKPDWPEIEYLKLKKLQTMTNFYMSTEQGMELVKGGTMAYHAEYNHVYPLMRILSDDQVCKLQYVHTVPHVMTWLATTRRGQFTDILRIGGDWLLETGLAKRMVSRWQVKPPPCRASLLAERVSYGDVAPLIILTVVGFVTSLALLVLERAVAKWQVKKNGEELIG
uniref:Ionotropic receptor IR23 n=1 Tax=Lobesia botrana TaxID=209534 RepID=A0A345BF30_9NEOP|nr:ionotropic receptor IR23 [Lobesia botrana]